METILAKIGAALLLLGIAFAAGYRVAGDHYRANQLDQALAYAEAIKAEQARVDQVAGGYSQVVTWLQAKNRTRSEEIIRETAKPDYRCRLPEPGRLLIRAAIRDANVAAAGQLGGEVPSAP